MKVSIILPCYNGANFVIKTLESIKNQTYKNWECIFIDDGSKDNTREVTSEYIKNDKRFNYIFQENKGVSEARNTGLKHVNGDYLFFVDSDDLLSKNVLESLIALMDDDIDIVFGKSATTRGQNNKIVGYLDHDLPTLVKLSNDDKKLIPLVIENKLICTVHNRLYRTSFIDKLNLSFIPNNKHDDDFWFFETLFFSRNIILNNQPTYFYNMTNDASIMNNLSYINFNNIITIINEIYNKYYKDENFSEYSNELSAYITNFKRKSISLYKKLNKKDQLKVDDYLFKSFTEIQPIRTKRILSNKTEKKLFKFYVLSLGYPNKWIKYQRTSKNVFMKTRKFIARQLEKTIVYSNNYKKYNNTIKKDYKLD